MGNQHIIVNVIAKLLLIASVAGVTAQPHSPAASTQPAVVSGVKIAPVTLQTLPETLQAVGTVQARQQSVMSSRLLARVVAVPIAIGERVQVGQLLVELDDQDIRTQLQRARAAWREAQHGVEEVERTSRAAGKAIEAAQVQAELTRTTLQRYQALHERRSVAPQEYNEVAARHKAATATVAQAEEEKAALLAKKQQVLARMEQARAEVASAEVTLGYTRIKAPRNGIVIAKPVEVGNLASPGVPLCIIAEERYRLETNVQESALRNIHLGQQATIHLDAIADPINSSVSEIVPAADPLSRTVVVKLDLPATAGLRPGLYGKARFFTGQRQVLLVPQSALVERGQLQGVFVLEPGNIARLRFIKTGRQEDGQVEILSGLEQGERIIVEGVEKVSDGGHVEGEQ